MNCQALKTIEHRSTTQTHLLTSAKSGGQFVLTHATIYALIGPSRGALWCSGWGVLPSFGHAVPPLDRLATVDVVGIFNREFTVLNGLIQFRDGIGALMTFMHHVIAETRVIVNGATWDDGNGVVLFCLWI
jgi:hypothetical protein